MEISERHALEDLRWKSVDERPKYGRKRKVTYCLYVRGLINIERKLVKRNAIEALNPVYHVSSINNN